MPATRIDKFAETIIPKWYSTKDNILGTVISEGSTVTSGSDEVARIVAIPLEAEKKLTGVFVVGLARAATSPVNLERLQFRASLAAAALGVWNRNHEAAQQTDKMAAASSADATFLDAKGIATVVDESLPFNAQGVTGRESARMEHDSRVETELKIILQWLDEGVISFPTAGWSASRP